MSPKDKTINLRVTEDWLSAVDLAAARKSTTMEFGAKVSRNALIEAAVVDWMTREGYADLVQLARGEAITD